MPSSRRRAPTRSSSLRCGKLQSFLSQAIAPNTFLREVPPTRAVGSSAGPWASADADLSSANSSPPGPLHPTRRAAGLGHGWPRPPHPGHISSWPKREGSQAARGQLRSDNRAAAWSPQPPLCSAPYASPGVAATIPLTWAEGRALLWEATRAPSQGPRPNGAARCRPLPFGLGTKALNPHRAPPRGAPAPTPFRIPVPPVLSFLPPRRPGTRRRSSVCSACAR